VTQNIPSINLLYLFRRANMVKQKTNQSVVVGLIVGLVGIPSGFCGYASAFLVGTLSSVYIPWGMSIVASACAIAFGWKGLHAINESEGREKGKALGYTSIVVGVLNILLLIFYTASY
jgi:hypothetical protein